MMDYILNKLKEPSTWKGIVWLITAYGLALSPDQKEAIATTGMAIAGLIGVFLEKGNAHTEKEIVEIAKEVQDERVMEIIANSSNKSKKNAKKKKSNGSSGEDFFGDSDGGSD